METQTPPPIIACNLCMSYYTGPKFNKGSVIIIFLLSHMGARLSNSFMLNSAEHGIPNAHKNLNAEKTKIYLAPKYRFYPAYKC